MNNLSLRRVGLLGWPVEHSLSPVIHQAAFDAQALPWCYELLPVEPQNVPNGVKSLFTSDLVGFNITAPYKEAVIPYLSELDELARQVGAVNTVKREDNGWTGYNTDVIGVKRAILKTGAFPEHDGEVVLFGNGGASVAVLAALKQLNVKHIRFLARNRQRSMEILERFTNWPEFIACIELQDLNDVNVMKAVHETQFMINATVVGMHHINRKSLFPDGVELPVGLNFLDLIYHPHETMMMCQVWEAGGRAWNGLNMLLFQAAAAYKIWTGIEAPLAVMKQAVLRRITT